MQDWCVDRHTRVVIRRRRAAPLGIIGFAIFNALTSSQNRKARALLTRELIDEVYRGVSNPPEDPANVLRVSKQSANRSLKRLGLRIEAVNRRHNSFWRLVQI